MNKTDEMNDQVWTMINNEKKKDSFLKWMNWIAWGMTLLVLLIFGVYTGLNFQRELQLYHMSLRPMEAVMSTILPFMIVLGSISMLLAILTTIGRFLRLRTTNLLEIQQRLSHLEQLIVKKD